MSVEQVESRPYLALSATSLRWEIHPSLTGASWLAKRSLDVLISIIGLLVLFPVLLVVAIAIKLDSPGPVIFRQKRVGLRGQVFEILKFRSMSTDAEARKADLLDRNDIKDGPMFKMAADPRVTRFGRFLRRASIDEIPQLVNVIQGHMSLVGPRALPVEEVAYDRPEEYERLTTMPGITGLWQVSGRSRVSSFRERLALDVEYVRTWSLWLDAVILSKTFGAVLKMDGSC